MMPYRLPESCWRRPRWRDRDLADFEEEISKLLNTDNEYEQELNLKRSKLAVKPARPARRCWQRLRRTKWSGFWISWRNRQASQFHWKVHCQNCRAESEGKYGGGEESEGGEEDELSCKWHCAICILTSLRRCSRAMSSTTSLATTLPLSLQLIRTRWKAGGKAKPSLNLTNTNLMPRGECRLLVRYNLIRKSSQKTRKKSSLLPNQGGGLRR